MLSVEIKDEDNGFTETDEIKPEPPVSCTLYIFKEMHIKTIYLHSNI